MHESKRSFSVVIVVKVVQRVATVRVPSVRTTGLVPIAAGVARESFPAMIVN